MTCTTKSTWRVDRVPCECTELRRSCRLAVRLRRRVDLTYTLTTTNMKKSTPKQWFMAWRQVQRNSWYFQNNLAKTSATILFFKLNLSGCDVHVYFICIRHVDVLWNNGARNNVIASICYFLPANKAMCAYVSFMLNRGDNFAEILQKQQLCYANALCAVGSRIITIYARIISEQMPLKHTITHQWSSNTAEVRSRDSGERQTVNSGSEEWNKIRRE